jgi:hypothetical protein
MVGFACVGHSAFKVIQQTLTVVNRSFTYPQPADQVPIVNNSCLSPDHYKEVRSMLHELLRICVTDEVTAKLRNNAR